jgi:pSer/pThr/pTyr-binding forkhead associated (FHA) protein
MGRAGNPGGPQRVSAHVVPKAKPYPGDGDTGDEEEKTTIESQWEDEASTTVEQGDVADKVRSLKQNNTNLTHTGGIEEPTVDDQHAPVLSAITPLRADQNARLAITQGNDTGQTFEIRPGKSYSVGRAIDNDIVLTDIAVSRRHFELRHEEGAWVIVDHRSGNGTVVNGNVEDNPFMLANGDTIEIGNTVFRFEQEKGPARPQRIEEDDEELSTVAGKPLRADIVEIEPIPTPVVAPRHPRPKTLPPPMPLRSIGASPPPPLGLPPMPASTMPLPQMANRPPAAPAGAPTMLGDQMGLNPMLHGMNQPMPNMQPTTIPGQSAPPRPSYPYPQATEIPPHSVHAQMLLIQTQNRRGDASTAHVPPMSYDGRYAAPPMQRYTPHQQPQISPRAKYIAGAAAIAVVAAIATIGIVKSGGSKPKPVASAQGSGSASKKAIVDPIKQDTKTVAMPQPVAAKTTTTTVTPTPPTPPKQEAPKQEAPKQEAPKQEAPKQEAPKVAVVAPPKQEAPKQEAPKQVTPKQETKVVTPKQEKKTEKKVAARKQEKKEPTTTTTTTATKTVATADSSAAKSKADDLYKRRKFNDAASTLQSAAKSADEDEARELRATSDYYTKLGKALNVAEAPQQDPITAYDALRRAANYDSNLGGFFKSDIEGKLGPAASKAANRYLANKDWQNARTAVIQAEKYGADMSTAKSKLESVARELYQQAQDANFQTQNAKDQLKQITQIVDSKSPWFQKATKAIAANR